MICRSKYDHFHNDCNLLISYLYNSTLDDAKIFYDKEIYRIAKQLKLLAFL